MCSSSIQNSSLCSYKIATRGKPITRMDFVRPQGAILYCEATFCIWLRTSVLLWESDWILKVCFYKYELMTKAKSPKAQSQIILISFYIIVPNCISPPKIMIECIKIAQTKDWQYPSFLCCYKF